MSVSLLFVLLDSFGYIIILFCCRIVLQNQLLVHTLMFSKFLLLDFIDLLILLLGRNKLAILFISNRILFSLPLLTELKLLYQHHVVFDVFVLTFMA